MSPALESLPLDPKAARDALPPRADGALLPVLRASLATSALAALVATVAVEATPHTRGLGFRPELRFAVLTPSCFLAATCAAFGYRALAHRTSRPRRALALVIAAVSLALVGILRLTGSHELASAALPPVLSVGALLAFLAPRVMDGARPTWLRFVSVSALALLEVLGVVAALRSERSPPKGDAGLAVDVPRSMFDVEHRFLTLPDGARIHYVDEGAGETLLFLHGNPSWSFQWRDLVRDLRGSYRCVALDYPGFGLSDAPPGFGFSPREESLVVEQFVDRLGLRDLTLVMQDWGGPIGVDLTERRPELVRDLILGSTWAWPTTTAEPRGKFSFLMGGPLGEFVQMSFGGFVSFGIEQGIVRALPRDVLDVYESPFRPLDRRGIAAYYPGQINGATSYFTELEAGLPRIADKPALIFWALRDRGFPRADLVRWESALPRHRTIELANADHFFFEDARELMVPEIRAFLAAPR